MILVSSEEIRTLPSSKIKIKYSLLHPKEDPLQLHLKREKEYFDELSQKINFDTGF